jgi:hypothetical protein
VVLDEPGQVFAGGEVRARATANVLDVAAQEINSIARPDAHHERVVETATEGRRAEVGRA